MFVVHFYYIANKATVNRQYLDIQRTEPIGIKPLLLAQFTTLFSLEKPVVSMDKEARDAACKWSFY